ncbi:MAG: FKBP-type peptidyl-prolyl cis-trans isomerase [Candidatus Sulfotelmatobacter sp.]
MQKSLTTVFQLLAAGMMLLGNARAQQTPAATTAQPSQPASASSQAAAPAKPQSATAAKKPTTAAKPATGLTLTTQKQKASYALGMKIGSDLKRQGVATSVDAAIAARGLKDALAGSKLLLTEDQEKAALTQLQTEVRAAQEAKAKEASGPARKAGEAFLAENKSKEGVVTLPSGMQYKILTAGTGPKPTTSDTVTCNYRGTLISGKEFDSSYKRGQPASFPVSGVIKGWTEALQLMPVGSKWQLFIPPDLAYGDRGAGADIGPGETLIFEVELISIGEQKK